MNNGAKVTFLQWLEQWTMAMHFPPGSGARVLLELLFLLFFLVGLWIVSPLEQTEGNAVLQWLMYYGAISVLIIVARTETIKRIVRYILEDISKRLKDS